MPFGQFAVLHCVDQVAACADSATVPLNAEAITSNAELAEFLARWR